MKKHIFIMMLFALCLTSFQAHAQRYLPGMKGLQVTAGMTDGVHWNAGSDFAYHIGAAYSVYTKNANRWVIGGEYLHKKYDYKDMQIPVEQFTAEGGYYLKFLSDRRKTFFLSLGLSALAGYAEYMISHLLKFSSLQKDEFVLYDYERIKYKNIFYNGVKSNNFLYDDWQIITLERLFHIFFQKSLYEAVWHIQSSVEDRFNFLVTQVERITGLKDFGIYLNKLMTIDAVFVNEDRHMHNVAVLMSQKGEFSYCPIFDNGAGLLSDTSMDYPLGTDLYDALSEVRAKTISGSFEEQMDVSEDVCGMNLHFSFTKKDVEQILNEIPGYSDQEKERVRDILFEQMRKYKYLFKN